MEYRDKCDKKPFRDEFINNCRKNKQQFGSSVNSGSFQRVDFGKSLLDEDVRPYEALSGISRDEFIQESFSA